MLTLHKIYFYEDRNGKSPVYEYMEQLAKKNDKDSRIKLNKIGDYIETLKQYGTAAGEPYIKHLDGKIWELRPLRDRILFVGWVNGSFVLLHHLTRAVLPQSLRHQAQTALSPFLHCLPLPYLLHQHRNHKLL